ncbi:MAG: hypothetical protein DRR08_02185 [Candidatus Parabeggiatoa sp. nov. 2]|nr:MAG: hypothetical protein B6247_01550 [Beggiatoa sp. 4572_84]RKZ63900.1 MAG: hypothetical protein DRR08_02185 [Gammaproteobacteria bacterium]HEC85153.1 hypothetical protein [Thioploca sp.]
MALKHLDSEGVIDKSWQCTAAEVQDLSWQDSRPTESKISLGRSPRFILTGVQDLSWQWQCNTLVALHANTADEGVQYFEGVIDKSWQRRSHR